MTESKPLEGKVALITGASGGIGAALAGRLAGAGADLALTYHGHPEDAERVAAGAGVKTLLLQGDLGDREVPGQLVGRVLDELGAVDILIANAGVGRQLAWDEVDIDTWDTTLAVNTRAPFLLAQAALPGMIDRGWGRILFVSSVAALNGGLIGPHYAASKAALHGLTHHLAARVAGKGVTVNALAPALIGGTRILPRAEPGELPAPIPVGRLGEPDEVASIALSMVTNAYLTNQVVSIDGGLFPH